MNDFSPLITVNALKAALSSVTQAQANVEVEQAENHAEIKLHALVQGSKPAADGGFILKVQLSGQSVLMQSALALPRGTELVLATTQQSSAATLDKLELQVLEIILPAPQHNAANPTLNSTPSQSFIEQVLTPFLASRAALLTQAAPSTSASAAKPVDTYAKPMLQVKAEQPAPNTTAATNSTRTLLAPLLNALSAPQLALPEAVKDILQQWQTQLHNSQQLADSGAVKQALLQSGLSYEKQVISALLPELSSKDKSTVSQLFKQLLGRNFTTSTNTNAVNTVNPTIPNSAKPTLATQAASTIGRILEQVKEKLEAPIRLTENSANAVKAETAANSALAKTLTSSATPTATLTTTPTTTPTPPSLLQTLLSSDTKAVLSRALITWAQSLNLPLQAQHQPQYPEAFQQLQQALARIEHEQGQWLQQTQGQNSPTQSWQLTIPLIFQHQQQAQEVRMVIDKDTENTDNPQKNAPTVRWRLRLYFDLAELGPLDVDLELLLPKIKATFWSQQSNTLALLNHKLQPLRQQLTALGAEVDELRVLHGQLPEPARNTIHQNWVDIHG